MNIAVLSGKGGTGKTTISTNMALAMKASYIDCDVEEPNGFLFLNPEIKNTKYHYAYFPQIDSDKCDLCGECVSHCNFNALAKVQNQIMVFEKLCHDCRACSISCKKDAIEYLKRATGIIKSGKKEDSMCIEGILNIGEPMAPPIIKNILKNLEQGLNIIDCPPGTSCSVVSTLRYCQGAILVTEPSVFGLHDLKMAVELVRQFDISFGVIINKEDKSENMISEYCKEEGIEIIGHIPYKKETAVYYSNGELLYQKEGYGKVFEQIISRSKEVLGWS